MFLFRRLVTTEYFQKLLKPKQQYKTVKFSSALSFSEEKLFF